MLMPAAVLVVIVLAAMAVDQSIIFMRQRSLVAAAQAAANDAVNQVQAWYRTQLGGKSFVRASNSVTPSRTTSPPMLNTIPSMVDASTSTATGVLPDPALTARHCVRNSSHVAGGEVNPAAARTVRL